MNRLGAVRAEFLRAMVPRALPANEELRGRLSRIAANHFVLIRSFLIESDAFRRSRATICAKIFITPAYVLRASSTQNVAINMRKFFFEIARRAGYRRYKNPYFIVFFAIMTMRAQIWSHVACTRQ